VDFKKNVVVFDKQIQSFMGIERGTLQQC